MQDAPYIPAPVDAGPEFPLDLTPYMPTGALQTLSLAERGALVLLLAFSWREEPPCSLPDDSAVLAAVVGIRPEQWSRLPRLAATFTKGADGRLHLPMARRVYERLKERAEAARAQRRAAGLASARARSGAPPAAFPMGDPTAVHPTAVERPFNGRPTAVEPAPCNEARARAERSRSSALSPGIEPERPLSAQSADVIAQIGSAGARALAEGKVAAWRRDRVREMLRAFVEELREKRHTTAPLSKADELAGGPWSTPEVVDAAITRVRDRMSVGEADKPMGYLISLLGMGKRGRGGLAEVSVQIAGRWSNEEAAYARRIAAAVATAAAIGERRMVAGGVAAGGPVSAVGA